MVARQNSSFSPLNTNSVTFCIERMRRTSPRSPRRFVKNMLAPPPISPGERVLRPRRGMRAHEADAHDTVRPHGTGRHDHQEIAHRGEHRVAAIRRVPEEVRHIRDVLLAAREFASAPDCDADVRVLFVAVAEADAVDRIAAEVVADKRREEALGGRRAGNRRNENGRHEQDWGKSHRMRCATVLFPGMCSRGPPRRLRRQVRAIAACRS